MAATATRYFQRDFWNRPLKGLKNMDVMLLRLLSDGLTAKEIPGLTEQGVKNRLFRLRQFLNVRTTTQAVAEAIRRGIIE
jgi:DNA-binding NarL/FixJ family response regulator